MSLVWGAWFDTNQRQIIIEHLKVDQLSSLIGLAAGGGFVVFAFGYIIGTFTYAILSVFFYLKALSCGGSQYHEAAFSCSDLKTIWQRTGHLGKVDRKQELSAVAVFDFGRIREKHEGVHQWLMRRYTAFIIGSTSVTGLFFSFVIGNRVLEIPWKPEWYVPVLFLIAACAYVAWCAWKDGRRMGAFLAQMPDTFWNKSTDK
jgi:hypothetical protein